MFKNLLMLSLLPYFTYHSEYFSGFVPHFLKVADNLSSYVGNASMNQMTD